MAACISRSSGPEGLVGFNFGIDPALQTTVAPTQPSIGVPFTVTVTGVSNFLADDNITLRKTACGGADLAGTDLRLHGTGPARHASFIPTETAAVVIVCLTRAGPSASSRPCPLELASSATPKIVLAESSAVARMCPVACARCVCQDALLIPLLRRMRRAARPSCALFMPGCPAQTRMA